MNNLLSKQLFAKSVTRRNNPGNAIAPLPFSSQTAMSKGDQICHLISRTAINALHQELCAYPKPGLVSQIDSGSHEDMDAATFLCSMLSLQDYFFQIAAAGTRNAGFDELRCLGLEAESRMLQATRGINTHRGAIFSLGLLSAAAAFITASDQPTSCLQLSRFVSDRWGSAILLNAPKTPCSHGTQVASRFKVAGAREEAAAGFPHLFNVGLPSLRKSLQKGADLHNASIQSFFSIMAVLPDNNLLYRGGEQGLMYAQAAARAFLDEGGVHREDWQVHARAIHEAFIERRLSPGGSADILSASIFVHQLN
jgi:triphosphoribosyl-dephospho-CoA synthase